MAIKLHQDGEAHAKNLIAHGKVDDGPFGFDGEDKAKLLGPKGTDVRSFAAHHLGKDEAGDAGDAKSYRYPFGKEGRVYRRALDSIRSRAEDNGHDEVRASAEGLIGMLEAGGNQADVGPESNSASPDREVRCLMAGIEIRAAPEGTDSPGTIVGYAAVFDRFSEDLGYFREKIRPGAFADCLKRCDVRALKNHDPGCLLGRSKPGTLRLREDELGLRVEIDLPGTQLGRDTAIEIGRKDMDGQSFSFTTDIDEWDYSGEVPIRTLIRVRELYDVGPVTYPAYTDTSAAMRALDRARPGSKATVSPPARPVQARHHIAIAKARLQLAAAYFEGP